MKCPCCDVELGISVKTVYPYVCPTCGKDDDHVPNNDPYTRYCRTCQKNFTIQSEHILRETKPRPYKYQVY